jgi:hypothetical protein
VTDERSDASPIKTPWKLRKREHGADFYPRHRQRNGIQNAVPGAYYDQVMGNCFLVSDDPNHPIRIKKITNNRNAMNVGEEGGGCIERHSQRNGRFGSPECMGFSLVYFVVLAPTGLQIQTVPYDKQYVNQTLLPNLIDFWHNHVLPAFAERDSLGPDGVYPGWIPDSIRKRTAADITTPSVAAAAPVPLVPTPPSTVVLEPSAAWRSAR